MSNYRSAPPARDLSRRSLLGGLGLGVGGALLGACSQRPSGSEDGTNGSGGPAIELGVGWWGSDDRHAATIAALDIISARTGWTFRTDYGDWGSYWDKLTTQLSGGTAPDVLSMNVPQELTDYAKRNALLPLDDVIDISVLSDAERQSGLVDGTLYGVTLATACPALIPNLDKLDALGLSLPESWTWQDLADFATSVYEESDGTLHGMIDGTDSNMLDSYLMQRGYAGVYDGNALAGTEDDYVEWFRYWGDLRSTGGIVTAEINAADDGSHPNNPVVRGLAALSNGFNITVGVWAALMTDRIGYAWIPSDTDTTGNYVKAASLFSLNAATDHVDEGADFISTFISDPEVSAALGFSRGVPNATALTALTDLSEAEQELADYSSDVAAGQLSDSPVAPTGAADVAALLGKYADEVAFGRRDPEDGARSFWSEANEVTLGG